MEKIKKGRWNSKDFELSKYYSSRPGDRAARERLRVSPPSAAGFRSKTVTEGPRRQPVPSYPLWSVLLQRWKGKKSEMFCFLCGLKEKKQMQQFYVHVAGKSNFPSQYFTMKATFNKVKHTNQILDVKLTFHWIVLRSFAVKGEVGWTKSGLTDTILWLREFANNNEWYVKWQRSPINEAVPKFWKRKGQNRSAHCRLYPEVSLI